MSPERIRFDVMMALQVATLFPHLAVHAYSRPVYLQEHFT